jgi:zinc protease
MQILMLPLALTCLALTPACGNSKPRPVLIPEPEEVLPADLPGPAAAAEPSLSPRQIRLDALSSVFAAKTDSDFAGRTAAGIATFSLTNGMPVAVRHIPDNRVVSINVVLRGGAAMTSPAQAGIEGIMLNTMMRASSRYSYEEMAGKLDETSSSMSCGVFFDYAVCTLHTLDRYVAELMPLFGAALTAPLFSGTDFDFIRTESLLSLQAVNQNPWRKTAQLLNDDFFAGHPYAARLEGTEASLAALTVADVRRFHESTFSANRLLVVAVGNIAADDLKDTLEAQFGAIPDRAVPVLTEPAPFSSDGPAKLIKAPFAASRGVAYIRGDFAAPAVSDPDYPALLLAARMLNDLLFNVVRDQHGAAYSVAIGVRSFKANYGSISVFKTSAPHKVKEYVNAAVRALAAGQVMSIAPSPEDGPMPRQPLATALDTYKAMHINSTYRDVATTDDAAALMIHSAIHREDPRAWLLDMDRVRAVTAEDVQRAVQKWLLNGRFTWLVLGSDDVIAPVREDDFNSF